MPGQASVAPIGSTTADASSGPPPPAPALPEAKAIGRAVRNVILFGIVVGISVGWAYANIHWLFAGIFALAGTGALGALLVIPKLVPEEAGKEVQKLVWELLFKHRRATVVYVILLFALFGLAMCVGYVEVAATGDASGRDVRFLSPPQADSDDYAQALLDADPQPLAAGTPVRDFYLLWPGSRRRAVVKVSGLPDRLVVVGPLKTQVVHAPEGLRLRPVVLLRPMPKLVDHRLKKEVVVQFQQGLVRRTPFTGHAIWVGCDADVEVPKATIDLWERTQTGQAAGILEYWKHPEALPGPRLELKVGDSFTVIVQHEGGKEYATQVFTVRIGAFPQVEDWHEPQ
jgi:hypothetical protein